MAAIDLELGLERGGRGWGKERPELLDNFDSEMQEWEDQLQDIQRKIEELYNDVQARRGANDNNDSQKNGSALECGLGHHGNGLFAPERHGEKLSGAIPGPHHYSNSCNYNPNGHRYPASHQNGYGHCHPSGVSQIGELLQDYLGNGKQMSRKNNGARHVHFSDTIKVRQDISAYPDELRNGGNERLGEDQAAGSFEETENRKNRGYYVKSSPRREGSPNKENTVSKPPIGQRDSPVAQARSQHAVTTPESPAMDRKSFSPGVLGERKCSSPSVLRKFGAMLQENEGKTLTESGVVTHQGLAPEAKCLPPGCQRKAPGAHAVAGRVPGRVPTQKCQADSDVLTAEVELSQERGSALDSGRQNYKDQRGGYSGSRGPHPGPQQTQRRSHVSGSPKIRPRANSAADRDGGPAQVEKAKKAAPPQGELKMDNRIPSSSPGGQRIQRGGLVGRESPRCGPVQDDGLIELLDMLEIQHEYSSSPRTGSSAFRQEPPQVNSAEMSPVRPKKSFSRPARPANQRPPSRWASHTPTARIAAPSGPIYRPPSPLSRTPSPMTRTPSPALKHRPPISCPFPTETVIM